MVLTIFCRSGHQPVQSRDLGVSVDRSLAVSLDFNESGEVNEGGEEENDEAQRGGEGNECAKCVDALKGMVSSM